ncbi:hypothetical protein EVAR_79544_1 [Eumeta japonica]|uniref:Uncharacterized protein n=1 Tax=Eumeta variegata TaxID=151549 RepID=A0A4C1Y8S8_EUMVA|nr:hypothetical protein EVAR_79544_1 [Eumeta japonica]
MILVPVIYNTYTYLIPTTYFLHRSELPTNDAMRIYRSFFSAAFLLYANAGLSIANFTAANTRALYCTYRMTHHGRERGIEIGNGTKVRIGKDIVKNRQRSQSHPNAETIRSNDAAKTVVDLRTELHYAHTCPASGSGESD